jgi:hypothetical protein
MPCPLPETPADAPVLGGGAKGCDEIWLLGAAWTEPVTSADAVFRDA